nr:retrovirus-related Pol polyprotein from transposon TNT 1-94 [Tanacetum cinerariifolium]
MNPWGGNTAGYGEAQNRVRNVNQGQARPGQARTIKCYNCNGTGHIAWNCTQPKRPQNSEYFKDKMLLMQAQENGVALDAEQLLFLAADPISDEVGPSYDSDILSEVQDHDQYLDDTCAYQEEHVMHDSVQLDHIVDLHADHTSISNMIPYDQYVKDNDVSVVHSTASSVLNDTFMGRENRGQWNNAWGAGAVGYGGAQNRVADDCNAFDSDVDEAPTAQTMFMANLSSADLVYDEADPSYDSDVLSEYVKENAVQVVQSDVSAVPNDAYMMILNDIPVTPPDEEVMAVLRRIVKTGPLFGKR